MKSTFLTIPYFCCLLTVSLLACKTFANTQDATEFLKASFTIDVELKLDESQLGLETGRGMITAIGSGTFLFDFCFEDALQSEELQTEGSFQLQHYESLSMGSAKDCRVTLDKKDYEPKEVTAHCEHHAIDLSQEHDGTANTAHEFQLRIPELPIKEMVMVKWDCGGTSRVLPDPSILTQLYLPLFQESWNFMIPLDETRITTRKDVPLNMGVYADVTFGITLSKLETP